MKIDVATALEGCSKDCDEFDIYSEDYYADGQIYLKRHKCRNMNLCLHLLRHLVINMNEEAEHDNSRD